MSTRYLVAAMLMASACAAQADVLPTVQGSDSANLVKSLFDKASASPSGEVNLSSAPAQGTYVVGTSNAVMATMLGNSFSALKLSAKGDQTAAAITTVSTPSGNTVTLPQVAVTPALGGAASETVAASVAGNSLTAAGSGTVSAPQAVAPTLEATAVPEPGSIALMMAGMLGVVAIGRRRAR